MSKPKTSGWTRYYERHPEDLVTKRLNDRARHRRLANALPRGAPWPTDPDELREFRRIYMRAWKKRNPEKVRFRKALRTKRVRAYLWDLQGGKCAICGTKLGQTTHVDHIVPVSRGGSNARSNLQLTHPGCNMRKFDLDPIDFARIEGRLL